MQRYIVRRVGEAVLALFALSIIIFLMVRLTGDPALLMLPPDAGADALVDIRHSMGLDKPLVTQYGLFIRDYAKGSFGDSLRSKTPVSELIKDRL
ncbi:MAG: ABC transporter permease, partial [SAR202 cluster bacterium]|nr:ABC transporter permease [SAR202 cluster bacterium]